MCKQSVKVLGMPSWLDLPHIHVVMAAVVEWERDGWVGGWVFPCKLRGTCSPSIANHVHVKGCSG